RPALALATSSARIVLDRQARLADELEHDRSVRGVGTFAQVLLEVVDRFAMVSELAVTLPEVEEQARRRNELVRPLIALERALEAAGVVVARRARCDATGLRAFGGALRARERRG